MVLQKKDAQFLNDFLLHSKGDNQKFVTFSTNMAKFQLDLSQSSLSTVTALFNGHQGRGGVSPQE